MLQRNALLEPEVFAPYLENTVLHTRNVTREIRVWHGVLSG
jgi:hypothetical protein